MTRISATHHRFQTIRANGDEDSRELATREFLFHDLLHYALECEAGLDGGFYGGLARGESAAASEEALIIEMVVGALTGAMKAPSFDTGPFVARTRDYLQDSGKSPPAWLGAELVDRVRVRMRQLLGRWKALAFGETMNLSFPSGASLDNTAR